MDTAGSPGGNVSTTVRLCALESIRSRSTRLRTFTGVSVIIAAFLALSCISTPDPAVLRWIIPDGLLPFTGPVSRAPSALQALLDDGTLAALHVEPETVLTMLGPGHQWSDDGVTVRSALVDALGIPRSWQGHETARALGPDDALVAAAQQIIDGPLGDFVASHGGRLTVREAHDGIVDVVLDGSCHGCPAAVMTLRVRLERRLRRRCPWLRCVRQVTANSCPTPHPHDGTPARA